MDGFSWEIDGAADVARVLAPIALPGWTASLVAIAVMALTAIALTDAITLAKGPRR